MNNPLRPSGATRQAQWLLNQDIPLLGSLTDSWAISRLSHQASHGEIFAVEVLLQNLFQHFKPGVRKKITSALCVTKNPLVINHLWTVWDQTRQPILAQILEAIATPATHPPRLEILSLIRLGALTPAAFCERLSAYAAVDAETDPVFLANRAKLIRSFKKPAHLQSLCRALIEQETPHLQELVLQAGFAPDDPQEKALFLFITAQWQVYHSFDFDLRLMRTAYLAAAPSVRSRITRLIQQSGQAEFLPILTGPDQRSISKEMSPEEGLLLVSALARHADWQKCWDLLLKLPPTGALTAMKLLIEANWQPEEDWQRDTFLQCKAFLENHPLTEADFTPNLPAAVACATIKVRGRVNDLAFSPAGSLLAIGTGERKVVLWDYRKALVEKMISGFEHSIGLVRFSPEGKLYCGERTNRRETPCKMYSIDQGQAAILGSHTGGVIGLQPLSANRVISAGKDDRLVLWDATTSKAIRSLPLYRLPRALCLQEDEMRLALISDVPSIYKIEDLSPETSFFSPRSIGIRRSAALCAAFTPGSQSLAVGHSGGEILLYTRPGERVSSSPVVYRHESPVRDLAFLKHPALLFSAESKGKIHLTHWPAQTTCADLQTPDGLLTSLAVSPDGHFFASGDQNAHLTLWDLRALHLSDLFSKALAALDLSDASTAASFSESKFFPETVRNALKFVSLLLRLRFQYDIVVADASEILPGEFDIIIDTQTV